MYVYIKKYIYSTYIGTHKILCVQLYMHTSPCLTLTIYMSVRHIMIIIPNDILTHQDCNVLKTICKYQEMHSKKANDCIEKNKVPASICTLKV